MSPAFRLAAAARSTTVALAILSTAGAQMQFATVRGMHVPDADDSISLDVVPVDANRDGSIDYFVVGDKALRLWIDKGQRRFREEGSLRLPSINDASCAAAFDVDRDGDTDLVVGRRRQNEVSPVILLNTNGVFTVAPGTPSTPIVAQEILRIDYDRDGDEDIFFAAGHDFFGRGGQSRLWRNDGSGRFVDVTAASLPQLALATMGAATGDVDGNGVPDIVLVQRPSLTTKAKSILLSGGTNGRYAIRATAFPDDPEWSNAVALDDVDGDGDLDAFIANEPRDLLGTPIGGGDQLWLGDGKGDFRRAPRSFLPPESPSYTRDCVFVDVTSDGRRDLVLARTSRLDRDAHNRIWVRAANGSFTDQSANLSDFPRTIARSNAVAITRGPSRGTHELFFATSAAADIYSIQSSSGLFVDLTPRPIPEHRSETYALASGDFNGDGHPDFVSGNFSVNRLWLGRGDGNFVAGKALPSNAEITTALLSFDADGDGDLDIFVGDYGTRKRLLLGDGRGGFVDRTLQRLPFDNTSTTSLVRADFDGDGDDDICIGNERGFFSTARNSLLRNVGGGVFNDASGGLPNRTENTFALAAGDLDGDGRIDLVVGNRGAPNRVLINMGSMRFRDAGPLDTRAERTRAIALGDVDGDGDLDVLVGNASSPKRVYLGDGKGAFRELARAIPGAPSPTTSMALVDLDRDGDLDIFVGNASGTGSGAADDLFLGDGSGRFVDARARLALPNARETLSVLVADLDADLDDDIVLGTAKSNDLLANLRTQASAPFGALVGSTWHIDSTVEPGYARNSHFVFGFLAIDRLATPLAIRDRGVLHIDPAKALPLPPLHLKTPGGVANFRVPIPLQLSPLLGRTIYAQLVTLPTLRPSRWWIGNLLATPLIH